MPLRISAIISDYDGTLSPTSSLTTQGNKIPQDLENILTDISSKIPVCVLSSKDLRFLSDKVNFARIVSGLLGVETIEFEEGNQKNTANKTCLNLEKQTRFSRAINRYYITKMDNLLSNSKLLKKISDKVALDYQDVRVENKFTFMGNILAGITLDYRHIRKWSQFKTNIEPFIIKLIERFMKLNLPNQLFLNKYSDHPFIDVYAVKYHKGLAVKSITKMLNFSKDKKILYLGDSENDNPAFRRADLSVGVRSDNRLNVKLESNYVIEFNQLKAFLHKLKDEDFVFDRMSENFF